jgi:hypothetical protein
MEEPTFTAIDYNSLENRVIEGLVGDYYQMVKNTFETVLYGRIHIHDIQRMIISRPGFRLNQEMFKGYGKGNSDKG